MRARKPEKLEPSLISIIEIFYSAIIFIGYHAFVLSIRGVEVNEYFNPVGIYIFIVCLVAFTFLLLTHVAIKVYIKYANRDIYYSLNLKRILIFALPLIIVFEVLFKK